MPGTDAAPLHEGEVAWIAALNWASTIAFAAATVVWSYRYFRRSRRDSEDYADRRLSAAGQAMMAAGMAITYGVMG